MLARRSYPTDHVGRARSVDELEYYLVLANFKMAIVLEGGYARMVNGESDNPKAKHFGEYVLNSARKAGELVQATKPM